MAEDIGIQLLDIYEPIDDEDIKKSKEWTLRRIDNSILVGSLIKEILEELARNLTKTAYKYNCKPEDWQFSQNEELRNDVADLMDDAEGEIMALVEEYSLNETQDKKRRASLLPWLLALSGKGSKDLSSTLHKHLQQFLFDTEAQIAAMKMAAYGQSKAITRVLSTLHSVYTAPEVISAFRKQSAARYIKSKGVHKGNVGLSSSGANNVENFGSQTATLGWEKMRYEEAKEEGKAGYVCFRGSTYPCSICDEVCNIFHPIEEGMVLPVHTSCCCYAVFVNEKEGYLHQQRKA